MSGEGIQTIDFLILTREVGFSPTFLKRGSNLVSATIYIYIYTYIHGAADINSRGGD